MSDFKAKVHQIQFRLGLRLGAGNILKLRWIAVCNLLDKRLGYHIYIGSVGVETLLRQKHAKTQLSRHAMSRYI